MVPEKINSHGGRKRWSQCLECRWFRIQETMGNGSILLCQIQSMDRSSVLPLTSLYDLVLFIQSPCALVLLINTTFGKGRDTSAALLIFLQWSHKMQCPLFFHVIHTSLASMEGLSNLMEQNLCPLWLQFTMAEFL